jgi:leucyl aminopeptidase
MRHALSNESWKSLLPDTHDWLDKVAVTAGPGKVDGAHHVVAVKTGEDAKDQIVLSAPKLDAELSRKIIAAATALNWKPSAGALHVAVDGTAFTLVPVNATRAMDRQLARQLGLDAAKATKELKINSLALCTSDKLNVLDVLDGYVSGLYNCAAFKGQRKQDPSRFPQKIALAGASASDADIRATLSLGKAQAFTRFLQDAPPNYMNPLKLAEVAKDMARDCGLACKVLDKEQMTALGMGSFLSVSDGGQTEPRTIVIEIPGVDNSKCVALVGKGLTFDSGGISLKPGAGMEEMKYDMSGGAAVLGVAKHLSVVKPPVKTICIVGATENMPGYNATRPGDMVRAMNGKTIEVLNTDAEGRLVLADCLHYAISEYKPDLVIDIATLTGAVLIALGCVGSAVISNSSDTAGYVLKVAEGQGEPMWQLPLWPELEKEVKGDVADLKNIAKGSVKGGSIMGGMFLKEFVGDAKWAHLDIAGTGWNCQATGYPGSGGSAFGLRTMAAAVLQFNR